MGEERENDNYEDMLDAQSDAGTVAQDDDGRPNWTQRELSEECVKIQRKRGKIDIPFLLLTLMLLAMGLVMVLSSSFARELYTTGEPMRLFTRQLVFAASGVAIMLVVSRLNARTMSRWSTLSLVISIFLLVAVLAIGIKVNGSRRWIGIGGKDSSLTFQPSEIAKVAVILFYSQMICKFGKAKMKTLKYGVLPFVGITAVIVVLLGLEPHLSAIIIITALVVIMMFAGGTRLRWFLLVGVVCAIVALAIIMSLRAVPHDDGDTTISGQLSKVKWGEKFVYAGKRIDAWLDPEADPYGDGFQIRQSLMAVGSGGLLGEGLGQGRQKYMYLPEEHNDYIFAIVCEELGFIGAILILMLYMLLIVRGYWLAIHARDQYSSLITTGITSLLAIQVFLSVGVVTNLLPSTGLSLPFFSYGGTALWIQLVQMGVILAVSRDIPLTKKERQMSVAI